MNNERIEFLLRKHQIVADKLSNQIDFSEKDLLEIRERSESVIHYLKFWESQDNSDRFEYELRKHIEWLSNKIK